jgi:hypothetical protein
LGKGRYQMGIGGLHSQHDRCQYWQASDDLEISDFDVGSFYPNIMVNAGIIPRGLGLPFVDLFRSLIKERMAAKHEGRTVIANSMKILLNGTFGKLGSMFSKVYSPDLLIAVTITGQFYLLSLIEIVLACEGHIISANTDGIAVAASPANMKKIRHAIAMFGWVTNFEFDETPYRSIAIKDVNNYIAVKTNGKTKAKGIYAESGLMKNPTNEVCTLAAQAYLANGTPIESFIKGHLKPENFADFTQSRTVNGGAVQYCGRRTIDDWVRVAEREWVRSAWAPGRATVKRVSRPPPVEVGDAPVFIGRVARWYYSSDRTLSINYQTNDNLVGKSEGGRVCLKLPTTIPSDLDLPRYVEETKTNLRNMGVPV